MTARQAAVCLMIWGSVWMAASGARGEEEMEAGPAPGILGGRPGVLLTYGSMTVEYEGERCQAVPAADGSMDVLVPADFLRQNLRVGVLEYPDAQVLLQQGEVSARLESARRIGDRLYLPLSAVCETFGYETETEIGSLRVCLRDRTPYRDRGLPAAYDYRLVGRSTRVRDQGNYGTCWSFASLTALETALRPGKAVEFSADHMSLHNGFSLNQSEGGEYTMSMAYLLGWQGPVLEEQDPYGDGISPDGLKPAVHVQEIQILPPKDYEAIKEAVFFTGGVQTSMYTSITGSESRSVYYKEETNSYCYQGELIPNHDVVIVGWDDEYPKENFQTETEGDGAFLCVSSWGEKFGDRGYFYVSYYDTNIGISSLVYTGVQETGNYDHIYQTDLCGWVGQMGYGSESVFGANIYQAQTEEVLKAVGFYATGAHTSYEIWLARHVGGEPEFEDRRIVAEGEVARSGFYTVSLPEPEVLEPGERFAVILKICTPGAVHPMAMEYRADEMTAEADITDGEGYISHDGRTWVSAEERYQCNLCLKAYTGEQKTLQEAERSKKRSAE